MAPPSDAAEPPASKQGAAIGRREALVTVLLVVAAVATSWSSYEATRWHGEQALATSRTNATRILAARAAAQASAETQVDVATYIAWADADRRGQRHLADFYVQRFRPEFATAFQAWTATHPLTDPAAPSTPFAMPAYHVAARAEADRLDAAAEVTAAEVARDIQRASNYVLSVVLYAVVLFFAGMSTNLGGIRVRRVMIAIGYLLMIATLGWVATFPVSLHV